MSLHNDLTFTESELNEMYSLKSLVRYNNKMKIKNETVAEHSFFTAMLAMKICERLELDIDTTRDCIIKALLHDMPEIELNDVTYDVKVKCGLYPFFAGYEDAYFDRHFPRWSKLTNDHSNNVVNCIVDYADALSVLQYSYNEAMLGNKSFDGIIHDTLHRLATIKKKLEEVL